MGKGSQGGGAVLPLDKGGELNALAVGRQRGPKAKGERGWGRAAFSFDGYPPMAHIWGRHHTRQQLLPSRPSGKVKKASEGGGDGVGSFLKTAGTKRDALEGPRQR